MNHLKDFLLKNGKKIKVNNKNIKTNTAQGMYCPIIKTLDKEKSIENILSKDSKSYIYYGFPI